MIEAALSARADNEDPGMEPDVLDAHVARCPSCQAFARRTAELRRQMRVRPAPAVPDLSDRILAAVGDGPAPRRRWRGERTVSAPGLVVGAAAVVVVLMAAFLGGRLLAGGGSGGGNSTVQQVSGSSQASANYPGAIVLPVTYQKPNVTFTDTEGKPYNVATATPGQVTLLYFGYTHCPDVCPINMQLTADALKMLPAAQRQKVTVVFITTDPNRDTPAVMRQWLNNFSPSFVGLTGTINQIHQAEAQTGVAVSAAEPANSDGNYTVTHAGYTLVFAQDNMAHLQVDVTEQAKDYATTLNHLLARGYQGT